jgi:colanic acid biosynthesis glycosyl transferase WcaI
VIVTKWFPPEHAPFGIMMDELATFLAKSGHAVTVVTGNPTHPSGVLDVGFDNRLVQTARRSDGVEVVRVWSPTRSPKRRDTPPGFVFRVLGFASFALLASLQVSIRARRATLFAVLQPLVIGPLLLFVARLIRARVILNVQDLHPDALVEVGLIRNRLLIALLRNMEGCSYKAADAVTVISDGFRDHCIERGAKPNRVAVVPNWIDDNVVMPLYGESRLRREAGLPEGSFVALYAGTVGHVSGAEVVIRAAARLRAHPHIRFLFIGEGPALPRLQSEVAKLGLSNVAFLPFQPRSRLAEVQSAGDVSLVTLLPGKGRTSVPSKVLGYMAAARPVLASVDASCETARLISVAGCGVVVAPDDEVALCNALEDFFARREALGQLGARGREYLVRTFNRDTVLMRYGDVFRRFEGAP